MFERDWQPVDGMVVSKEVHKRKPSQTGQWYVRFRYVIEYKRPGGEIVQVTLKEPEHFRAKLIAPLEPGEIAPLLVDAKSGKVRFDTDDPRVDIDAWLERRDAEAIDG